MSAARRDVEALQQSLHRIAQLRSGVGMYARPRNGGSHSAYRVAHAKAAEHELATLQAIAARLDKATAPKPRPFLVLPGQGTVARTVLEVLHVDALGHDHHSLRDLVGLTDAELAVRITGAGPNTVRPRRIDLVRGGWVEVAGQTGTATRWTLTEDGKRAMDGLASGLVTHLMADSLLDACGTAPRGSLSVTPVRDNVTCVACLRLPVPAEEVAAGE